jgi:hypothetical protein
MALSPDLSALDRSLRSQNGARVERLRGTATAVDEPAVAVPQAKGAFVPPVAHLRSVVAGSWCVRYRYALDDYAYTHRADSPADLVRFMRDAFQGNQYLDVLRVWEDRA